MFKDWNNANAFCYLTIEMNN